MRLDELPPRDDEGHVLCVVEAPRGSRVKTQWDPQLGVIVLGRALPLGAHYPFDWGFVPGTRAPDGDPIDVLVLHDAPTHPGVVIPSFLLGVVKVEERKQGRTRRNDRLLAVPADAPRFDGLREASELTTRARREIERFFLTAAEYTPKDVRVMGWGGARVATRLLDQAIGARARAE